MIRNKYRRWSDATVIASLMLCVVSISEISRSARQLSSFESSFGNGKHTKNQSTHFPPLKSVDLQVGYLNKSKDTCSKRCDQEAIHSNESSAPKYKQLDQTRPYLFNGRTHHLKSIPSDMRLPPIDESNFTAFLVDERNWRFNRTYYFEYNPTIVPLKVEQLPLDLKQTVQDTSQTTSEYYLAGFRVSSMQGCLTSDQMQDARWTGQDQWAPEQFALAILDRELNVVRETVFPVSERDIRLFNLGGQLYMAYWDRLVPIWITPTAIRESLWKKGFIRKKKGSYLMAMSSSEVELYHAAFDFCCTSRSCQGKNFNYFWQPPNQMFVETNPVSPHVVERIDYEKACRLPSRRRPQNLESQLQYDINRTNLFVWSSTPSESFQTTDHLYFSSRNVVPPYTRERGSACCIKLKHEWSNGTNSNLLVGVSHVKATGSFDFMVKNNVNFTSRQYTSRFYAFEPFPPFRTVAISGSFCLGFPEGRERHPYAPFVRKKPFKLGGASLDCPYITFVSGLSESVDDPSTAILSYGINDCAGRIAKVSKTQVAQVLFQEEDVFQSTNDL